MPWFSSLSLAFFLVFSIIPGVFARVSQQVWAANLKLPSCPMKKLDVDFDLMDQQLLGWTQWICPRVQNIPQEKTLQDTLPRIFPINWEVGHHSVTLLLPCPYFDVFLLLNCPEARLENRNSGNYLYQWLQNSSSKKKQLHNCTKEGNFYPPPGWKILGCAPGFWSSHSGGIKSKNRLGGVGEQGFTGSILSLKGSIPAVITGNDSFGSREGNICPKIEESSSFCEGNKALLSSARVF